MVRPSSFARHVSDIPVSPDGTLALVKGVVIPFLFKLAGACALRADVEVLEFSERGPRLAVRPHTNTDTYRDVYFAINRKIVEVLSANGFPVPRIPMQISDSRPSA